MNLFSWAFIVDRVRPSYFLKDFFFFFVSFLFFLLSWMDDHYFLMVILVIDIQGRGTSNTDDYTLGAQACLPIINAMLAEIKNKTFPQKCFLNVDLPTNIANHKVNHILACRCYFWIVCLRNFENLPCSNLSNALYLPVVVEGRWLSYIYMYIYEYPGTLPCITSEAMAVCISMSCYVAVSVLWRMPVAYLLSLHKFCRWMHAYRERNKIWFLQFFIKLDIDIVSNLTPWHYAVI